MEYNSLGAVVEPLCLWYEENKRSMPWRDNPAPYHVWISEIMLQQTRIEAAKGYYERFLKRLPTIESLADVSEEELLKLWEGLGYYNRARNLHKAAKILVEKYEGNLPADYGLLLELPGVGSYTAGAIASIAYGITAPAVDGNVLRVLMRFMNCRDDISKMSVRKKMERSLLKVIPKEYPGKFNQALMELGEVICIPNGTPACAKCPLTKDCLAKREGTQMELPVKPEKKARRIEKKTVLIIERGNEVGIVQRPREGLLAGMWEFPSLDGYLTLGQIKKYFEESGAEFDAVRKGVTGKHVFSHVEWHMKGFCVILKEKCDNLPIQHIVWAKKEELENRYAVPVAYHVFLRELEQ